MLLRLIHFLVMLALACAAAALFGVLHNQVSYRVGPDYFHVVKFAQFRVAPDLHGAVGAALVGVQASWWMGVIIGVPIAAMTFAMPSIKQATLAFVGAIFIVLLITGLFAASSLFLVPPLDDVALPQGVSDPVGFGRAAMMHSASYLGGLGGLIVAMILVGRSVRHARRAS